MEAKSKVAVSKVSITKPSGRVLTLAVGKNFQMKVKVTPSKATNKKVSYQSANSKIAKVNKTGKITARKKGTTKITVKAKDGSGKKATLTVKVIIPVKKVTFTAPSKSTITLTKGKTYQLKTKVTPSNATIKKLKYSSSKKSLATVNSKGKVTLKKAGTVKITAKTTDGSVKKAVCTIKIKNPKPDPEKPDPEQPDPEKPDPEKPDPEKPDPEQPKPEDPDPEQPTPEDGYKLVWQDEFAGTALNTADWNYELHQPGWVNSELQEYTDSPDNILVQDGKLVIKAIKTVDETGTHYTSGRINTQNKHDYKYGRFETRAKVPSGKGFLPAFWMMPTDENLYGQWPKCGELDIMEVLGDQTATTYGTLHFGEPHTQKQGSYTLESGDFASEYHVYACEWEPSEIRFYVDGTLFYTVNDWFTKKNGFGEVTYPAPYDQPFYMILNLAVGGNWPGNPEADAVFAENAELSVDYVRVYQREHYDENVEKPIADLVLREPDATGNYMRNGDFAAKENLSDAEGWSFLLAGEGAATAQIAENQLVIDTMNAGNLDYSVQVVQPDLPMEKGYHYRLTFDASATEPRTMIADISGPDNGYIRYFPDITVALTDTTQSYSYEFDMTNATDANGRLEFNLGNQNSTAQVRISNVRLEKTGEAEMPAEDKNVLVDGNYIYNGEFQEGSKRLAYWSVENQCANASVSVTNENNVRELKVSASDANLSLDQIRVKQDTIPMKGNKEYVLSFDAYGNSEKAIKALVAGQEFTAELTTEKQTYKYSIHTEEGLNGTELVFLLGNQGDTYIDNVRIQEDGLFVNGDFSNGFTGFEVFTDSSIASSVTYAVDGLNENNAAAFDIRDTGDADWKIQLKQNNINLENGKWYKITLDAKSSIDRMIMYALQRDGSSDNNWIPYSDTQFIDLTQEYQTFTRVFQMTEVTDPATILSISMGSVKGIQITEPHTVCIDNITLEEVEAPQ